MLRRRFDTSVLNEVRYAVDIVCILDVIVLNSSYPKTHLEHTEVTRVEITVELFVLIFIRSSDQEIITMSSSCLCDLIISS